MKYKVFLINMKNSLDRLAFMTEQLNKQNITFDIQEGYDGATYNFEGLCSKRGSISMTSREKAIALSHRTILNSVKNAELDYVLVLEDDVEIPNNFKEIIEHEITKRTKNITNWEYLSFNYPTVGIQFIKLWIFLFSKMFKKNTSTIFYFKTPFYLLKFILVVIISLFEKLREETYKKVYKNGKPTHFYRPLYLAGCYLLTRKGIDKLLTLNKEITYTADELPNVARIKCGLKFYAFVPLLVKQRRDKFRSFLPEEKEYYFNN